MKNSLTIVRLKLFAFSLCLFVLLPAWAQDDSLTSIEQQLRVAISQESERALKLLEDTVEINSGTMNFDGVRAVGAVFAAEFDAIGFDTEWYDGSDFNRAGHLLASHGSSGPRLLLIGHLDTVFASDSPFQNFERVDPHSARGPGTTDMKGGNVIMIQALRALQAAGVLDQLAIRVVLTGDEEKRGTPINLAVAPLIEAAQWADVAIGFEDGDGDPKTAVISRRGSTSWQLTVSGKPAHSSQVFRSDIGDGAIYEAARILDQFRSNLSTEPHLTFNPGVIVGGTDISLDAGTGRGTAFGKENVIARSTRVAGDLRALSLEQREEAKRRMQEIVANNLNQTEATIKFRDSYPPMGPTDGNRRLLALLDQASRDLGHGPVAAVDPSRAGAADISFTAGHVRMAIDGVGLMGDGGHTEGEIADLRTMNSQTERVAVLLYRLLAEQDLHH
jgi:glutamate carboxypeptidase